MEVGIQTRLEENLLVHLDDRRGIMDAKESIHGIILRTPLCTTLKLGPKVKNDCL
jgi:hypothetical protein